MTAEPAYNDDFDDENTNPADDLPPWVLEGRSVLGGVSMGKLPEGQWRYMTSKEKF